MPNSQLMLRKKKSSHCYKTTVTDTFFALKKLSPLVHIVSKPQISRAYNSLNADFLQGF